MVARAARDPHPSLVKTIIIADVAWVVGAAILLITFPDLLSTGGRWTLAIVSLIVTDLAALQHVGLRRSELHSPIGEPIHL